MGARRACFGRVVALGTIFAASGASAQALTLSPLVEARMREEHVEQAGIADHADAVTLRLRTGVLAKVDHWNLLVEAQGTLAVVGDYFDGLHGPQTRPLVPDPQNVALYRAQVQYKDKDVAVTVGRQRISLDDDRFVDAALFRQNAQTYDAVRIEWTGLPRLRADATYSWKVHTIWGIDGVGVRPASIRGDDAFLELSYVHPIATVTAFGYLVSQNDPAFQRFRLSSQTWGARLAGSQVVAPGVKVGYKTSFARQSDWRRNPNDYAADFSMAELSVERKQLRLAAGYEISGASSGAAFTSFQYPVGSGIRYRGSASEFNPTPPDGLRDSYVVAGLTLPTLGPIKSFGAQAVYHSFYSDRAVRHYGDEVDVAIGGKLGRYALALRLAAYNPDTFAPRTRKLWAQIDWAL